jgi:hypothetical protein
VFLVVLADTGQVLDHGDAELSQMILVADAGLHEQLRSVDGSLRDDHFRPCSDAVALAAVVKLHPGDPSAVQGQSRYPRVSQNGEIGLTEVRGDIGAER